MDWTRVRGIGGGVLMWSSGLVAKASVGVVVLSSAFGCKAVIDADGYVIDESAGACGAVVPKLEYAAWKTCVLSVSCVPGDPPFTISECLTLDPAADFTLESRDYRSCADVFEVVGVGYALLGECAEGAAKERCEGEVAVHCDSGDVAGGRVVDCAKRGATCQLLGAAGQERAGCAVPLSCSGDSPASCKDNFYYACVDGVAEGESCSEINAQCDDTANPPGCYLDTVLRCDAAIPPCVGDKAQECNVGERRRYEYDCSKRGLTCDATVGPVCIAPGCDQFDYVGCTEACDETGTLARVCFGGVPQQLDCKLLIGEASRCELRERAFDEAQYVRCSVD